MVIDVQGTTRTVKYAWRVYHADVDVTQCESATDWVRAFVERYGVPHAVFGRRRTFFENEIFSLDPTPDTPFTFLARADIPRGAEVLGVQCGQRIHDPPMIVMFISFMFNMTAYASDLRRHGYPRR